MSESQNGGTLLGIFRTDEAVISSPTVVDGAIFVGSADTRIYAIDAIERTSSWSFPTGGAVESSPSVTDGRVFVGSYDDAVYALDADTGRQVWSFRTGDAVRSSPTVVEERVFVGSDDGVVYALDADRGTAQWSFQTGGVVRSSPTVIDGQVFVGSQDKHVYALDAQSGGVNWSFETGHWVSSSPTVANGTVFVGSWDHRVYALDMDQGTERWSFQTNGQVRSSPTVADSTVYVGTQDARIYALTTAGEERWSFETDDAVRSSPTVADTVLFAGSDDRTLYALDADQGTEQWSFRTDSFVRSSPTVVDGTAFVGGFNDCVYVLDAGVEGSSEGSRALLETLGHHTRDFDRGTLNLHDYSQPARVSGSQSSRGARHSSSLTRGTDRRATLSSFDVLTYDEIEKGNPIGSGGNADVYHATVTTGSATAELALKEPRMSGTLHTETVERIMEEAETWEQLDDHDHIVSVVDYGSEPLPWIAMEYMDAGPLGERAGDLGFEQALWTAIATTKGVRHAHRRGVAHLDLKPENILFRSVENAWDAPKVADWGLSKHLLNHSNSVEGLSPQYAAPEQFDDSYGSTDDRTDIYQLGAVFYELFTGRPPFEGPPARVMNRVLTDEPALPSEITDVPAELDEVLTTALATERLDRYESVLYLRDDLQELFEQS
jgi:outer membrane protein assembly factor BamB